MTSTEIALLLNDDVEKIKRIGEIIGKKIKEKDAFEYLNEFEKTFILIDVLEHNINNGGFIHFFFNPSSQFTHEILEAYININATETIKILTEAIQLFPQIPVPKNALIRQGILMKKESNLDLWDHLDEAFYESKEDIQSLTLKFIKKHLSFFD